MECRICENCNHQNDTSFLECIECGADLSFVHPTLIEVEKQNDEPEIETVELTSEPRKTLQLQQLRFIGLKDYQVIDIPNEGGILGREGTISPFYFQDNLYVSNEHAEIILKNDGYVIIDLQSTNGTKINGTKIEKSKELSISPGDLVTIANMNFKVE
jgi:hypothetical protein